MRIRYEDLVRSPLEMISGLFERLLPGTIQHFDEIGMSDNRHQLFGNRLRRKPLSLADIQEDNEWTYAMPIVCRLLVEVFSVFQRGKYGYS
jgi:hypothetical protein